MKPKSHKKRSLKEAAKQTSSGYDPEEDLPPMSERERREMEESVQDHDDWMRRERELADEDL